MKEAFKKEKHHQQRQIAEANKIIRCGQVKLKPQRNDRKELNCIA